jgi:hydrogenase nickel incorporation protein HypA/HybF
MHEASIAQAIVNTVLDEAKKQEAVRVESILVELGELTFLNADQVAFWVETGLEGSVAQGAAIEFKKIRGALSCNACGFEGPLTVEEDPLTHLSLPSFTCPECKSSSITITAGKEALIRSMKIVKA